MVESRGIDGFLHAHVKFIDIQNGLQHRGDDRGSSGGTHNHGKFAVFFYDGRSHGTEHALARSNTVCFRTNQTKHVGNSSFGTEIIHFIVHKEAQLLEIYLRSIGTIQRGCHRNGITLSIHNRVVGSFHAF